MSRDPLAPFEYSPAIEMPGGPVVVIQRETERVPLSVVPEARQLSGGFGGLQRFDVANEVGPVAGPTTVLHSIPRSRRPFCPPIVIDLVRFRTVAAALGNICLPEGEARVSQNFELGGMKLSFDGRDRLACEATDREKYGLVYLQAKQTGPTSDWSCIVPPEMISRALSNLAPGFIEVAPSDRFLIGPQSFQVLEGGQKFPPRPPRPTDLDGPNGERETAFQCILRRSDLAAALNTLSSIIDVKNIRSNMRYIYVGPEEKILAGSLTKEIGALFLRVDLRSKARLEHPHGFHLPLAAARAGYLLGDDGAIMVDGQQTVVLSLTKKNELYVGGLESQDHFIRVEPLVQIAVAKYADVLTETVNTITVKIEELVPALERASEIHRGNPDGGFVNLYFGENKVVAATSFRDETDAIREDMEREITYVRANAPSMFTRTMVYRPDIILSLIKHIIGPEITMGFPKNATGRDPLCLFGTDPRRLAMLMPIFNHDTEENCDAGTC